MALSLAIDALDAGYGAVKALRGVSLAVESGETVALLGTNGNGKSTLMKCIMGLVRPERGSITLTIDGVAHDLSKRSTEEIVDLGVALVPEGRRLFPKLTVRENLMLGAFRKVARSAIDRNLALAFETFPVLKDRANQLAGTMSGGQQQMLAIARALLSAPKVMLLDEPSLGLSPILTKEIFDIIVRINRERGTTILLVEQNAQMALKTADFGYVLEVGRIVMEDTCAALMLKEDIKEFYLGIKEEGARGHRRWKKKKTWR